MMDINATIKSEVLRYMRKLSGETHTSLEWHREEGFSGLYNFVFKDRYTKDEIMHFELDFHTIDDIFEVACSIKKELIRQVEVYRNSLVTPMFKFDISDYIKLDVEQAKRIDKMVKNSVFGSGVFKPYASFNMETPKITRTYASGQTIPEIEDVIFNNPATIVFWNDGTKTVVKAQDDDAFDPEKGLAMAITKKAFGNKGNYCEKIKPWLRGYENQESTSNKNNKIKAVRYMLVNAMDLNKTKAAMRETINEAIHALGECVDD
jgi:hypothetical protein